MDLFVATMTDWKNISGFEGLYKVSTLGDIYSIRNGITLKCPTSEGGYPLVCLCVENKPKTLLVHRIVAETFIPNPLNLPQVNHINGVKTDNRVKNLEWVTCLENVKHAMETGLSRWGKNKGKKTRFTDEEVAFYLRLYENGATLDEVARKAKTSKHVVLKWIAEVIKG
jgi:hypothetical protein